MIAFIRLAIQNWHTVVVGVFTVLILGALSVTSIPIDILPINNSPAVQVLTFYSGMPASMVEKNLSNRIERWTGQAAGTAKQESRSIVGCSIVRNYYRDDVDPGGALTQVASLASVAAPYLPPGTLPPVILPFDPTATTPVCLIALDSAKYPESILTDTGRFEVRNMIMSQRGAVAPVVYGGKTRAILAYMNREQMQSRGLSPLDLMGAIDNYNIFMPTGGAKFGGVDYALDSNSMYDLVERMGEIPVKSDGGNTTFLKDVATPKDTSLVQASVVRVNGRRQVYVPVYRQQGASTLSVVNTLRESLPDFKSRLTYDDIDLKMVMDQSVYVQHSITSLVEEGVLGAILCSLVILLFLGEWRMTVIAVLTIPICVLFALLGLNWTGNTINVMTLAGLALAIGPLVDAAIICLENTHRHLGLGVHQKEAAIFGSGEVALPALVATCCTLLVLAPLAFMPGLGKFLFRPMAWSVTFSMVSALFLSWTLVPLLCSFWLKVHAPREDEHHGRDYSHKSGHENAPARSIFGRMFEAWELLLNRLFAAYGRVLARLMTRKAAVVAAAVLTLVATIVVLGPRLRREFFPEADAGTIEMAVRAKSGTDIGETERRVEDVENTVKNLIGKDLEILIAEIGVVADWSAAYTLNSGPMDAVLKIQLKPDRTKSAQEYAQLLRRTLLAMPSNGDLEFAFDTGGMMRSAMNEGKSTPINIQITAKNLPKAYALAQRIQRESKDIDGVVDCRIQQRFDYPQYIVEVDQAKASSLGLTQIEIMKNLVAAMNSSIQFNKKNFWIDPVSNNQYYVGVSYPEIDIASFETLLDIPITGARQKLPIPLRNVATLRRASVATEATHQNLQTTIDIGMGVEVRDLGSVSEDINKLLSRFGEKSGNGLKAYDPTTLDSGEKKLLVGSTIRLSGEYGRMQDTFYNLGVGLILASVLVYFLMVSLFKSWLTPLVILSAVPVGLVGVIGILYLTNTALNVQSLLGVIFMVGIVVSNTVLMVDFAQQLRKTEKLPPAEAIFKAASVRVRPVVMTALAAFFALLPMALGLARGSEANTPLGRSVVGGLIAGLVTTLFVVPALYALVVRDAKPHPKT
ncbi:MAG: efflux RND transporter permease subunit [Gemmataceae bacterium]|nr:efflux RND transporter permease subunit [Gemmataceae bacterium]